MQGRSASTQYYVQLAANGIMEVEVRRTSLAHAHLTLTCCQGFNVAGFKYFDYKRLPEDVERELGAKFADMDEVISTADVVTIHVPLTDKTCAARCSLSTRYHFSVILQTLAMSGHRLINNEAHVSDAGRERAGAACLTRRA